MEQILLKAYADSIVAALNLRKDVEYASVAIGEDIVDDNVEYHNLVWEVKFYWTNTRNELPVTSTAMLWIGHGEVGIKSGGWNSHGALSRDAAVDAVRVVVEMAH